MEKFEYTPQGFKDAFDYLKSVGKSHLVFNELRTDGFTVVKLANGLYAETLPSEPEEPTSCDRCNSPSFELHTCPFAVDIHGDYESLCNCCENCTHQCAMDI